MMRSYRLKICCRIETDNLRGRRQPASKLSSLSSSQGNFNPLSILIHISGCALDGKTARKGGIRLQESIDGRVIPGCNTPLTILANQILLHHKFAVRVEWLADMSEHRGVHDCQISRHAYRADFDSLKLIEVTGALQTADEAILRNPIP